MGRFVDDLMERVTAWDRDQVEFHQAVREVAESVELTLDRHPEYRDQRILERMIEPERVIMFRVPWVDDSGGTHINRGYRVEMNSAIGPYKEFRDALRSALESIVLKHEAVDAALKQAQQDADDAIKSYNDRVGS